ncbi:hypothetical protein RRG08_005486 [Elysia crispata]|uniref:Uncharacterized protein n=1 Tax=Elysia crispata TaxID=231223 RepID=A0AAE1CQW7_9GAST|nr:hypothetical protein RRG08_005486 [Elysia crispata]
MWLGLVVGRVLLSSAEGNSGVANTRASFVFVFWTTHAMLQTPNCSDSAVALDLRSRHLPRIEDTAQLFTTTYDPITPCQLVRPNPDRHSKCKRARTKKPRPNEELYYITDLDTIEDTPLIFKRENLNHHKQSSSSCITYIQSHLDRHLQNDQVATKIVRQLGVLPLS